MSSEEGYVSSVSEDEILSESSESLSSTAVAEELEVAEMIIKSGALALRDCDNGEEPFVYSSGNRGPGYIMIKGLVGQPRIFRELTRRLAMAITYHHWDDKVATKFFDFIDGNATGGMICAWELRNQLSQLRPTDEEIPYVYLRGTRKAGGHNELITGDFNNPLIKRGDRVLVVEELVNYGQTTINAVQTFREAGYPCQMAACLLSYDHEETNTNLAALGVKLISLITLPRLLTIGEEQGWIEPHIVASYREFLADPIEWQFERGIDVLPEISAKEAEKRGYKIEALDAEAAIEAGAPAAKVRGGIEYYQVLAGDGQIEGCGNKQGPFVFVALDGDNMGASNGLARNLDNAMPDKQFGFKINLDRLLTYGIDKVLYEMPEFSGDRPIFLDFKTWNGSKTMLSVLKECCHPTYGDKIRIINVYALAGEVFLRQLVEEVESWQADEASCLPKVEIFALTVLTHYDDQYCQDHFGRSLEATVLHLAAVASAAGCHGVILPAHCLSAVKAAFPDLKTLCPGLRPGGVPNSGDVGYQKQICSIEAAINWGADYLVIGSPITKAADPVESLDGILKLCGQ